MPQQTPDLPGWNFDTQEISAGIYKVVGRDRTGRTVEATGLDPDELIARCKRDASQLNLVASPPDNLLEDDPRQRIRRHH